MFRLVFKEPGDINWRYEEWSTEYEINLKKYKLSEFFVENENRMIVFSS